MKTMQKLAAVLAVVVLALVLATPVFAGEPPAVKTADAPFSGVPMGKGLGAGLVLIGAAIGFAKIGSAALESMARQPEVANKIQVAMIIIGALLEGATFFALIVVFGI